MNQDILDRILRCPALPTLPAVAVRVIELTQSNQTSVDELARTIQNDQGLAAKILKTVNSSFYGLRRPCASINQALVMLGLSTVKSLALSFSLVSTLADGADDEFDHVAYWRRGLYTATAAKLIAREAGVPQEEEAFLGGLLQDVGMMAMYMALGRSYLKVILEADSDHRKLVKFELAAMELQHPDVGAMLVQRWKLPDELVMPVKYHERPTAAPGQYANLVRCVGLGNVAHDVLTDAEPLPALKRFHERAKQWFEIDGPTAESLLKKISESARELSTLFRLKTGAFSDADAILEKAKVQIAQIAQDPDGESTHGASLGALVNDADEYDPLTGVLSRRAWDSAAESAFAAAKAAGGCLSVLQVGIDAFPRLASACGGEAGDTVLVETGAILQEQFDQLGGRVGRSENATFVILLPAIDRNVASQAALAARGAIESAAGSWPVGGASATVSIGAATMDQRTAGVFPTLATLTLAAGKAMQAAERAGGNCVRAVTPKIAA